MQQLAITTPDDITIDFKGPDAIFHFKNAAQTEARWSPQRT